jgi:zinc protease
VIILDKPGSPQSMILAGHVSPASGDPASLTIGTMNDVFGGKFTARINMNLREDKGWAYGAYTFMPGAKGQRPYIVYAPVQTDKTKESLAEIIREFSDFLGDRPASQEELDRVIKDNTRSLPGRFETANAVLGSLMSSARYGRDYDYVTTLKTQYEAMTTEALGESAAAVLAPDRLVWLIIGDREKIEAGVRELGIAEVEVWDQDGNPIE